MSVVRLIVATRSSNILVSGKIIKEMPDSVASGTPYTFEYNRFFDVWWQRKSKIWWTVVRCIKYDHKITYSTYIDVKPKTILDLFIFGWPCISLQILANNQLHSLFMYLFISSRYMFRASQCSSSGDRIVLIHHLVWLVCVTSWYASQEGNMFHPDRHAKQSFTQNNHTRWYINTIRSPDDEHCDARNM